MEANCLSKSSVLQVNCVPCLSAQSVVISDVAIQILLVALCSKVNL